MCGGSMKQPSGRRASQLEHTHRPYSKLCWAGILLVVLAVIYHLNGDFLPGNDAKPAIYLPTQLLHRGTFTFGSEEHPSMFLWKDKSLRGPRYFLVPTVQRETKHLRFVSTFGPGAGLTALPFFAILDWWKTLPLENCSQCLWYGSKTVASLLVAASACFLFLSACRFLSLFCAFVLALVYGLGTCVWSISSQALWQHGPTEFFWAAGIYCFLSRTPSRTRDFLCGLTLGCAVACRPTSFALLGAIVLFLLKKRHRVLYCLLGSLPPLLGLAAYNTYYLGSPFVFGQSVAGALLAVAKTGSSSVWSTPLIEGLLGLLFSPSRGLFFHSPFLLFVFPAVWMIWRDRKWLDLRPLTLAAAAILIVESKHFDWWGGWSYGYRHIVDLSLLLVLFLVPAFYWTENQKQPVSPWTRKKTALRLCFVFLFAFSALVQVVGAWAYDLKGWNAKTVAYRLQRLDTSQVVAVSSAQEANRLIAQKKAKFLERIRANIDHKEFRGRLWSFTDNQIWYYLVHFSESRKQKKAMLESL